MPGSPASRFRRPVRGHAVADDRPDAGRHGGRSGGDRHAHEDRFVNHGLRQVAELFAQLPRSAASVVVALLGGVQRDLRPGSPPPGRARRRRHWQPRPWEACRTLSSLARGEVSSADGGHRMVDVEQRLIEEPGQELLLRQPVDGPVDAGLAYRSEGTSSRAQLRGTRRTGCTPPLHNGAEPRTTVPTASYRRTAKCLS
jgi:hypothetical protein